VSQTQQTVIMFIIVPSSVIIPPMLRIHLPLTLYRPYTDSITKQLEKILPI